MVRASFWFGWILSLQVALFWLWGTTPAVAFTSEQQLVLQAWRTIDRAYYDDTFNHQNWWVTRDRTLKQQIPNEEAAYTAITKMIASLDEPFTRLLRPEQYRSLQVNTAGELSGVGLQIGVKAGSQQIEVIAPIAGSPAAQAGILPHDTIVEIDAIPTTELTLDTAAVRMRGAMGTNVSLLIQTADKSPREVILIRQKIELNPVTAELHTENGRKIGYLRLSQFSAKAAKELGDNITKFKQQGAIGYVLDLRNNPGGLVQAGVEIARQWLNEGTIVYTVDRRGAIDSIDATGTALTDAPLAILVNEGSASASEILAGALQDNGRAKLIGTKTFGKGLIQSLFDLPNGSGLAVTVAKYETPNHHDIHKLGITPDRVVPTPEISLESAATAADTQYLAALKELGV
ncbi:carboxyl-terminal processing protease CtpA [Chamaesiphon sp. GL140_3_metabinner_50]|uniref:carboxyl-terminal processing protease CtpA n=1 Tax=Chamaesiphon sp. GL140_3_metabinner_50 TaxID=2970812 RepID=UPI0034579A92